MIDQVLDSLGLAKCELLLIDSQFAFTDEVLAGLATVYGAEPEFGDNEFPQVHFGSSHSASFVLHQPNRVPSEELDLTIDGNLVWGADLSSLEHHSQLTVFSGSKDPIDAAWLVLRASTLLLDHSNTVAVRWGHVVSIPAMDYRRRAKEALANNQVPTDLWLKFQPVERKGRLGIAMVGMESFDLPDLVLFCGQQSKESTLERLRGLALQVMIERGMTAQSLPAPFVCIGTERSKTDGQNPVMMIDDPS